MFWLQIKRFICRMNFHPGSTISDGPARGYWTTYCPVCDESWYGRVAGTFPREPAICDDCEHDIEFHSEPLGCSKCRCAHFKLREVDDD